MEKNKEKKNSKRKGNYQVKETKQMEKITI
jgi:hypothetical protein